ncbi:MAG: helix-turn-helix transcriptional regulator [Gemmatimonadota bacterium]|nr:MAG: helix-turn-helix transcriptional regulator [Gemmatimonadota bacterium]
MSKGEHLGEFEQMVLLALIRLKDNAYGMTIRQVIQERTDRRVPIGQVYAALERLESKGYLASRVAEPEPIRGGRSKKLYALTDDGESALALARGMMAKMAEGLELGDPEVA